jgi:DnaJ like chaperone protein
MNTGQLGVPRHWWGKIVLGVLGMFKGGIAGLAMGLFAGHMLDRFLGALFDRSRYREIFFDALFACLGHISKADGRVTEVEIAAAERFMQKLQLDAEERQAAIRRFNAGKTPGFDLEAELQEFARFTATQRDLRQMFMEILLEGATTDGRVTEAEMQVLMRVARVLGIPTMMFEAMMNAFRTSHGSGGRYRAPGNTTISLPQAYASLGLKPDASDAEVKKAYRKLVGQYHPDRLVSQKLPEEVMEKARNRVLEVNAAYDLIKQSRGFK